MSGPQRHCSREEHKDEAQVLTGGFNFAICNLSKVLNNSIESTFVAELIQIVRNVIDSAEMPFAPVSILLNFSGYIDDIFLVLDFQIIFHILSRDIQVLRGVAPESLDVWASNFGRA